MKALVLVETVFAAAVVAAWGFAVVVAWGFAGPPVASAALAAGLVDSVVLAFVEPAAAVFAALVVDFVGLVEFVAFEQATLYFH